MAKKATPKVKWNKKTCRTCYYVTGDRWGLYGSYRHIVCAEMIKVNKYCPHCFDRLYKITSEELVALRVSQWEHYKNWVIASNKK